MGKNILLSPIILVFGLLIVMYFSGGLDIIFNNPIFLVFIGLGLVVLKFVGGKK